MKFYEAILNFQTLLQKELWDAVRTNYERNNFSGSILDASYSLKARLRMRYGESEAQLCAARRGASTEAERPLGREHRSAAKPRRMTAVVALSNGLLVTYSVRDLV